MPFLPDWSHWIDSHVIYIPRETASFCGDLSKLAMLDVGCGDMIADIGLLKLGLEHITGLDVLVRDWNIVEHAAQAIRAAGHAVPDDYASRLSYINYEGVTFPFPDNSFDFVFSWSAFEHIPDVPAVLREMRRVVKPLGRVFIQVYPWFHTFWGSHISDFIEEPYFHLTRSPDWVHSKLEDYVQSHPDKADLIFNVMWPEYGRLNGYSARRFLTDVLDAGFAIEKSYVTINEEHIASVPRDVPLADAISAGSMVLLRPAKMLTPAEVEISKRTAEEALEILDQRASAPATVKQLRRDLELEKGIRTSLEQSISWRYTRPARALMRLIRGRRSKVGNDRHGEA